MRKYIIFFIGLFVISYLSNNAYAIDGSGIPLKYISSCEIDLNNDNESDIVLLVETSTERELIVLMKTARGYSAYLVSKGKPDMYLSCHFGRTVTETTAGKRKGAAKVYTTLGTYIQLEQPEGSSVVYFWNGKEFQEVWTSD